MTTTVLSFLNTIGNEAPARNPKLLKGLAFGIPLSIALWFLIGALIFLA